MEFLKSLWRPRGNVAIPEYTADDGVDLMVKSLVYMFKRLDISSTDDNKLSRHPVEEMTAEDMLKLDQMYNIDVFEKRLTEDPHRVLVEWSKNKFRSMLVLAHLPQMETLPQFDVPHFRFIVLEADASNDEYIRTLSTSDIYIEHNLPIEVRREIAATVLRKFNEKSERTLELRSRIIAEYLKLVATEIQVARIYKAMMGKMQPQAGAKSQGNNRSQSNNANSKNAQNKPVQSPQPPQSPRNNFRAQSSKRANFGSQATPNRFGHSRTGSNASKISTNSGMPNLGETPNLKNSNHSTPLGSPVGSPRMGRPKMSTSNPNININQPRFGVSPSLDAGKKYVLQQARLAVKARIEKEQKGMTENN